MARVASNSGRRIVFKHANGFVALEAAIDRNIQGTQVVFIDHWEDGITASNCRTLAKWLLCAADILEKRKAGA